MKLTFTEKWMMFWGLTYLVNLNTKEIHRLSNKKERCWLHLMCHKRYVTRRKALRLILKKGYNGCRYCFKEFDKG